MNPDPNRHARTLNVSRHDNALEARSVAAAFRLGDREATTMIDHVKQTVRHWPSLAGQLAISHKDQQAMAPAFRLAE